MTDDLHAAIHALQGDDTAHVQRAFAAIEDIARRDPSECALELSRAVLSEKTSGALRTPRLLTLLSLTRVPVPECLPVCLDLLRALVATDTPPPADAALGAAAIIARTQPRTLLPDVESVQADPQAAQEMYHDIVQILMLLLSITSELLQKLPESSVADMARWLWYDCATLDLMSLADFAGHLVEKSRIDNEILALMVDLVERVPATADQKRYASQRLQEAGVDAAAIEQLKTAWRAIRVSPAPDPANIGSRSVVDPEPPPPEPRVDEWLAAFSEGDEDGIELARTVIDEMFEDWNPPVALAWWVAVTVDALPPRRRRADITWALIRLGTMLRRQGERMAVVPPSLLVRWLDTPQLLNLQNTQIALYVLGRQQPGLLVQRYLYRAVAASSERHVEILLGDMWRALTQAEPSAVLLVASRWIAFGFGQSALLDLLVKLLCERARAQPTLIGTLTNELTPTLDTPADVVEIAHDLLDELRNLSPED